MIVLKNGRVELGRAGSDEGVAPEVATKAGRSWKGQALSFEVMAWIPGVGQRLAAWPKHPIRRLVGFIQLHAQWVAAQQWSKWLTTRSPINASQLPSAKCPLRQP